MTLFVEMRAHFAAAFLPRRAEWAGAMLLVLTGYILFANPTLMVETSKRVQTFDLLLMVMRQEYWARAIFGFGLVRLLILLINGLLRRSPHLRAGFAFMSCGFWFPFMLSYAANFGPAFAAFSVFLALEFSNVIVACGDARDLDHRYAGKSSANK